MNIKELFPTLADLSDVVPGIETSMTLDQLNSSATSAYKQVINIITAPVYKKIIADKGDALESLKSAVGNLAMAKYSVFDVLRKRKSDIAVYKSEQEAMQRAYNDNYFNSMDTLIYELKEVEEWKQTTFYKVLSDLKIQTCEDFNMLYCIDSSYYFFFRLIPIQKEVLEDTMSCYFDAPKPELLPRLKRALAQLTISIALRRFDPIEFPPSIRNLHDEKTSFRHGNTEQTRLLDLSKELYSSAMELLKSVNLVSQAPQNEDLSTETNYNKPEDKIYLLPL